MPLSSDSVGAGEPVTPLQVNVTGWPRVSETADAWSEPIRGGAPSAAGWFTTAVADSAAGWTPGVAAPTYSAESFDGRLQLVEYVPTVLAGPPGAGA